MRRLRPICARRSSGLFALAAFAIVWVLALSHPTIAQASEGEARMLFKRARALLEAGRFTEACPLFAESQELDPGGGTLLNLALCKEQLGETAAAYALYNQALEQATRDHRQDRQAFARERIGILRPDLSMLAISPADPVSGLVIRVDGAVLDQTVWGIPAPFEPGEHTVTAEAPSHQSWSRQVQLAGRGNTVQVVVPGLQANQPANLPTPGAEPGSDAYFEPPIAEPPWTEPAPRSGDRRGPLRLTGFASLGWLGGEMLPNDAESAIAVWLGAEAAYRVHRMVSLGVVAKRLTGGQCGDVVSGSCDISGSDVGASLRLYIQQNKSSSLYSDAWLGAAAGLGTLRFERSDVDSILQRDIETDITYRGSILSARGGYDLGGEVVSVTFMTELVWFRSMSAEGRNVVDGLRTDVGGTAGGSVIAYSAALGLNLHL